RIFLRNPEILVLDEPTSALDSFSEVHITEALHELFQNKTVVIVAHRLQTVKEADIILVLGSGGQVLEQGTHDELLAQGGEYAAMVDLQSGVVRGE
ncbi:MAG: ABC transporter ATP-binding protein, partial [Candidatus Gracilibacteria bacterium]|nr:ABC transporter ATP-binding protein [Candidatus Gracilibacteria bacterium]